jgi:hypothetical protein
LAALAAKKADAKLIAGQRGVSLDAKSSTYFMPRALQTNLFSCIGFCAAAV